MCRCVRAERGLQEVRAMMVSELGGFGTTRMVGRFFQLAELPSGWSD